MKTYGGFLISQIRQVSGRAFDRILRESGIDAFNGPQGRILHVLFEQEPLTITQIGKLTSLYKTSLTGMLERMEQAGLIERSVDPKNRRQTLVRLTPYAHSLREAHAAVSEEINQIFYRGFTQPEIEQFEGTLRRILENFELENFENEV